MNRCDALPRLTAAGRCECWAYGSDKLCYYHQKIDANLTKPSEVRHYPTTTMRDYGKTSLRLTR